jgi:nucleoid DNA-binding protein
MIKKGVEPQEFFKLVAINSGVNDISAVRDIYYGIIRTVSRELKDKQRIKLPDWGDFYLILQKSKETFVVHGENPRTRVVLPPMFLVKFKPDHKVKKYFSEFSRRTMIK